MLRKIKVEDLQEGMVFSEALFFDDGKNRVLGKMRPLSLRELTVLWQWNVPFVMTAGEIITKSTTNTKKAASPSTVAMPSDTKMHTDMHSTADNPVGNKQSDNAIDCNVLQLPDITNRSAAYSEYAAIITAIDAFLHEVKEHTPLSAHPLDKVAAHLRRLTAIDKARITSFIVAARMQDKEKAKAAVDTAVLAETIALFMKLPEDYIADIVIAALLHDCGMLKISESLLNKKEALSDTEMQTIAAHTVYGYKTVLSECMYTERVARLVLQHHERWDGKGYPNKLAGESIELGARIIAVCDAFTAMTQQRSYRSAVLGHDAMKTLLADKGRRFDYNVVKAIIQSIGMYPIGSLVLLNNTAVARVAGIAPESPLRPLIQILIDEKGMPHKNNEDSLMDLRAFQDVVIIKALDPLYYQNNTPDANTALLSKSSK